MPSSGFRSAGPFVDHTRQICDALQNLRNSVTAAERAGYPVSFDLAGADINFNDVHVTVHSKDNSSKK